MPIQYAQIKDDVVVNVVIADEKKDIFADNPDYVRIDDLESPPMIGHERQKDGSFSAPKVDSLALVKERIQSAMAFGEQMIVQVAAENVLLGVTIDQVNKVLAKTANVAAALRSGSLYTALSLIQALPPDEVLTQERINSYAKMIKDYLGMAG